MQDANNHPYLRMMTTRKTTSYTPLRDLVGPLPLNWSVSSNVSVSDDGKLARVGSSSSSSSADDNWLYMSAVCYLYGLNIHKARKVPVGLINSNWGGTIIQSWSSAEAMAACPTYATPPVASGGSLGAEPSHSLLTAAVGSGSGSDSDGSSHLWNAMIAPLTNTTIMGTALGSRDCDCECEHQLQLSARAESVVLRDPSPTTQS